MRHRCGALLALNDQGYVIEAMQVPSPNFDARPLGTEISLIVLHNISLPPKKFGGKAVLRLFANTLSTKAHPYFASLKGVRVSAHFMIRRQGTLIQFVSCADRAWHAGVSRWREQSHCNDFSIGIELEGADDISYTKAQYRMLNLLLWALARAYPVTDIVGHSTIAPERKTDPGMAFDWQRIVRGRLPRRVSLHPV